MVEDSSVNIEASLRLMQEKVRLIKAELRKKIFGQEELIDQLLAAILCRGHCLLIGAPGLAKTLLINTLSEIADLDFKRVQFTPDMMPADITGSEVLEENQVSKAREYRFIKGPIFTQMLLADEINRTPPKTQAALLEAMQEHYVTIAGTRFKLEEPFFVLATQNPIEQEGTYPLPEAQLDRFMFSLNVDYPSFSEEVAILQNTTTDQNIKLEKVASVEDLLEFQSIVRLIPVPTSVAEFAVKIVRATRPGADSKSATNKYLRWGAGPRACQYLALAGKVFAALDGRYNVAYEDIVKAAFPVLRHRVILNYHAEADGVSVEDIITQIINEI
ncbi:AAA family ATPase [Lentisphaerae bacterium WC36]|nr:AAA family ATPase [Lentisphaerae bacterium WC36]